MTDDIDTNFDMNGSETPPPAEPGNNRNFIVAVSVLGGLFLLVLVLIAVFVAVILPRSKESKAQRAAQINQANTATVAALTQIAISSYTPTAKPATATPSPTAKPSATAVVALPTKTKAPESDPVDPRTATVSALLTQAAQAKLTATAQPTSTALPKTGFAEDIGLPGLLGATVLLLVVILFARRVRHSAV